MSAIHSTKRPHCHLDLHFIVIVPLLFQCLREGLVVHCRKGRSSEISKFGGVFLALTKMESLPTRGRAVGCSGVSVGDRGLLLCALSLFTVYAEPRHILPFQPPHIIHCCPSLTAQPFHKVLHCRIILALKRAIFNVQLRSRVMLASARRVSK